MVVPFYTQRPTNIKRPQPIYLWHGNTKWNNAESFFIFIDFNFFIWGKLYSRICLLRNTIKHLHTNAPPHPPHLHTPKFLYIIHILHIIGFPVSKRTRVEPSPYHLYRSCSGEQWGSFIWAFVWLVCVCVSTCITLLLYNFLYLSIRINKYFQSQFVHLRTDSTAKLF